MLPHRNFIAAIPLWHWQLSRQPASGCGLTGKSKVVERFRFVINKIDADGR
jgi:hypothetical protein